MKISIAYFKGKIRTSELVLFRGALLGLMGADADAPFHHHDADGLVYGYPTVQYKLIGGRPAVLSVDVPLHPLTDLFEGGPRSLRIGERDVLLELDEVVMRHYTPAIDDAPKRYRLVRYLPLNEKNVGEYDELIALTDRICFLENIITANILSFFKGVGYRADEQIEVAVTAMQPPRVAYYKKVAFRSFQLEFVTNAVLPSHIGLGKSVSVGFGMLQRIGQSPTCTP